MHGLQLLAEGNTIIVVLGSLVPLPYVALGSCHQGSECRVGAGAYSMFAPAAVARLL